MLITLLAQHRPTSLKQGTLWLWLVLLGAALALGGYQLGVWLGQEHLRTDPAQQQQLASLRQRLTDTALLRDQQLERWQASEAILEAIPTYERTATASGAKAPVDGDLAPALAAEEDILEQP